MCKIRVPSAGKWRDLGLRWQVPLLRNVPPQSKKRLAYSTLNHLRELFSPAPLPKASVALLEMPLHVLAEKFPVLRHVHGSAELFRVA